MKLIVNLILLVIIFFISALILKIIIQFNEHDYVYSVKILFTLTVFFTFYILSLLFLSREWKISIIICSIAILFSLYSVEIYLKLKIGNINPYINKAYNLSKSIDDRSKFEVIKDLRDKGIEAHTAINPLKGVSYEAWMGQQGRDFFPLSGISNTQTILCNEMSFWSSYKSDKFGFNNPNEVYKNKNIDAVLIGDSFVHGACVNENEDVASVLRNKGLRIINFGYAGNGPLVKLATLMEYGIHFKPKDVFWFFFRGDMADLHKEYTTRFLYKYIIEDDVKNSIKNSNYFTQNLINRQKEIDEYLLDYIKKEENKISNIEKEYSFRFFDIDKNKDKIEFNSYIYNFFLNSEIKIDLRFLKIRNLIGLVDKNKNECLDFTCSHYINIEYPIILNQAREVVESWNGTFHFVYLPSWWEYSDYKKNYIKNKKMILDIVKKNNIKLIDFNDFLIKTKNPNQYFAFSLPNHYNQKGYDLLANQIFENISK